MVMLQLLRLVAAAAVVAGALAQQEFNSSKAPCHGCGHACDPNCNCGVCNTHGCASEQLCMGACNSGHNAKWCGGPRPSPPPTPAPAPPGPPPNNGTCQACGYECDANCNCGRCNTKPGCDSESHCLGTCDAGHNAKWCGVAPPPPTPPLPPTPPAPPSVWSTKSNQLLRNGRPVVLHGLGTTCTEYLARGIGMECWADYDMKTPSAVLAKLDFNQVNAIIGILKAVASDDVTPAVRIPMTASSWLGKPTQSSRANAAKYPHLDTQYQGLISALVSQYTAHGIVSILDLHWDNDDTEQQPMAGKDCVDFWTSVSQQFGNNSMVFYELYNEPHTSDLAAYANGDAETAGMLEMLSAVRAHSSAPVLIAGATGYAYDSASLLSLDPKLKQIQATNIIWNFHPYMGPPQAGAHDKCPAGFEAHIVAVTNGTDRPSIITEFGQACCPTDGVCESCPASYGGVPMGYDEAVLTIAAKYGVSWLPWAWRPPAGPESNSGKKCEDLNGGSSPAGLSLAGSNAGNGGDFAALWGKFAGVSPGPAPPGPPPSPPPSPGCPGGSLVQCDGLCPSSPPVVHQDCLAQCLKRCAPTCPGGNLTACEKLCPASPPIVRNDCFGECDERCGHPSPPLPPSPPAGACPGGNLTACENLCPASPPIVRTDCFTQCDERCGHPSPPPLPPPPPSPPPPPHGNCSKVYDQCGGKNWNGPHCCLQGCSCVSHGLYYSQCTPPAGKHTCAGG